MTDTPDRAGWFDDPDNSEQLRYFDGILWTSHTTPRRTVWKDPAAEPTPQPPSNPYAAQPGQPAPGPYGYPSQAPHTPGPVHGSQWQPQGPPGNQQPYVSGPLTSDGVPLAGMAARFAAWVIDCMVTWVIGLAFGGYFLYRGLGNYPEIVAEAMLQPTPPTDAVALAERVEFDTTWLLAFAIVQLIVGVVYHTLFLSRWGATPGKRAAGISVRLAERPGLLSASDAMRRSLLRPVLFMFLMTPVLGLVALPLSLYDGLSGVRHPQRLTLHDRIGRTVVVQGPQPR